MIVKPAIPPVPKPGEDRTRFDTAIKECMEIIIGRRLATVKELNQLGYGWKDLLSDATSRATGLKASPYNVFRVNGTDEVFGHEMDTVNRVISGQSHMPHDWAGTKVYLHAHWGAQVASVRTSTFRFAWSFARGYGVDAFSAPVGVDVTQAHCNIAYGHNIAEFSDAQAILPANCETDGLLLWSVRVTAQGATSVAYNPFLFMIDMHYQTDGRDTNERNRTATGFTKMTHEDDMVAKINEILGRLQ